jgi:hypothetical protein
VANEIRVIRVEFVWLEDFDPDFVDFKICHQTHKEGLFGNQFDSGGGFNTFSAGNGWILKSVSNPELDFQNKVFFVRGFDTENNDIALRSHIDYFNDIVNAMYEYNDYFSVKTKQGVIVRQNKDLDPVL